MRIKRGLYLLSAMIGFIFLTGTVEAVPVRQIPGLSSIIFWERTSETGPDPYEFVVDSSALTTRLSSLDASSRDFRSGADEFYDIFYSNMDGSFNLNGEYVTVEAVYNYPSAGLNLAEVQLNYDESTEFASLVSSFVTLGNGWWTGIAGFDHENAVDGNLLTHTFMGSTFGQSERLRLTLGFQSSLQTSPPIPNPEPSTVLLFGSALGGMAGLGRKKFFRK